MAGLFCDLESDRISTCVGHHFESSEHMCIVVQCWLKKPIDWSTGAYFKEFEEFNFVLCNFVCC